MEYSKTRNLGPDESWDFLKVNREPRFFHFVDTDVDWIYKKSSYFIPERNDDFFLVNQYTKETKQMLLNEPKYDDWCYDYFASGEKIDQTRWNHRNYKHLC
ncbi:hypothetical protein KHA80_18540 [Anaerobacillus sp. HL2]|nr:hypothetical protein KHA80_18540 [Anaerobacillus sp. HL2]